MKNLEKSNPIKSKCVPLYVDLDGSLIATDLLYESIVKYLKQNPLRLFLLLIWLSRGRVVLKDKLSVRTSIDASKLPYRQEVLEVLKSEKKTRPLYLVTATHEVWARNVAKHLALFNGVLATNNVINMKSSTKLRAIQKMQSHEPFDYLGNSKDDLIVWKYAQTCYTVNTRKWIDRKLEVWSKEIIKISSPSNLWLSLIKALRPHQWIKNTLIFVPAITSHRVFDVNIISSSLIAFCLFSMISSSVYVLNDLLDLDDDRQHQLKKHRPIANGTLPIPIAITTATILLFISLLGAAFFSKDFLLVVSIYYFITLLYSIKLKQIVALDVIILAILYTLRIAAGHVVTKIFISSWLAIFSIFIFLSLAYAKRYSELFNLLKEDSKRKARGYTLEDLDQVSMFGSISGCLSVLVFALYIHSDKVQSLYTTPNILWFIIPILLYWITRLWFLTRKGMLHEDPLVFALKDWVSLVVGLLFLATISIAAYNF